MTGERTSSWYRWRQAAFGDMLYCALALAGWVSTTLLAAAGCIIVLFMLAGNGSLPGFFAQVSLLGQHYLAAASPARKAFDFDLLTAAGCLCAVTGILRRGALISIFRGGGRDGQ